MNAGERLPPDVDLGPAAPELPDSGVARLQASVESGLMPSGMLWVALCMFLALGATIGWTLPASLWDWQPQHAADEPWRWWTAAFVHWSAQHLAANLAALAVLAVLGLAAAVPPVLTLAWVASWPFTHLALLLRPELAHYGGMSGLLHGAVAVVATWLVAGTEGRSRTVGVLLAVGLTTKVLLEAPWGPALRTTTGWDIALAPAVHLSGALCGLLCALLALARGPEPTR